MAVKLYVGNLPYSTTEDDLNTLFSQVGPVLSVLIPTFRDSGRSKGFGFVEMENDDEANAAIEKFNKSDFNGRTIFVNVAKPMEERKPYSGGERRGGFRGGNGGGGFRGGNGGGGFRGNNGGGGDRFGGRDSY